MWLVVNCESYCLNFSDGTCNLARQYVVNPEIQELKQVIYKLIR